MKNIAFRLAAATFLMLTGGLLMSSSIPPAASQPNESGTKYQITINNFTFTPTTVAIPLGAKVTWTNNDDEPHTVVSTNNAFPHSPALDTGESFSHTFAKAGTYEYYCSVHPKMAGKVVVR